MTAQSQSIGVFTLTATGVSQLAYMGPTLMATREIAYMGPTLMSIPQGVS